MDVLWAKLMEILMKDDQTWWEYSSQEYKKRNDQKKSLDESVNRGLYTLFISLYHSIFHFLFS